MKEKSKDISFIKIMGKLFPMIFRAAPAMLFIVGTVSVFHGISLYFTTVFSQKFFDSVTSAISTGSVSRTAVIWGIALGTIVILGQVMNGLDGFMGVPCSQKAAGSLKLMIHDKASSISPVEYEKTDTLDDINKAHEGSAHSTDLVIQLLSFATFYIPYTIFMSLYLFRLKPILAISLFAIFLPIAVAQIIKDKSFSKLERDSAPLRREYEYYEECITSRQYFKETYIWGAADFFKGLYMSALSKLNKKIIEVEVKCKMIEFAMKAIALIGYFFVLYLLTDALLSREISVGAFAAVFASIAKIFSMLEVFVDRQVAWIARHMGSIRNFVRFVSLPDRKGLASSVNISNGISLKNVCFRYPDAQTNAVNSVTLDIKPNETIAIVGENGAGKTTLVKLIIGIYTPDVNCTPLFGQ